MELLGGTSAEALAHSHQKCTAITHSLPVSNSRGWKCGVTVTDIGQRAALLVQARVMLFQTVV